MQTKYFSKLSIVLNKPTPIDSTFFNFQKILLNFIENTLSQMNLSKTSIDQILDHERLGGVRGMVDFVGVGEARPHIASLWLPIRAFPTRYS